MRGPSPGRLTWSVLLALAIPLHSLANCRDPRFKQAQRAEHRGDLAQAAELYRQAALACRADRNVLERLAAVRSALVQALVADADRRLLDGQITAARDRLQQALRLDPGASFARQRLQQLTSGSMAAASPLPEAPPQLAPLPGVHSFDYRGDVMGAYQEVARQFGLSASFDPELPHRMIRFRVPAVDFPTAMRLLAQLTGTTWRPVNRRMFFVFADTPAKRQQYGAASVATVLLPESATPDQMDALTRAVRDLAGLTRTHLEVGTRTLTLEGPRARVELARRLIDQLDRPTGEILLEVDLLEVDRQQAEQMGLTPPSSAQMFTLTPAQITQAQASLEGLLDVLTQVFGQPSALAGLDFAQVQALLSAGRLSISSLLPPLVAFGGGRTRFLATLPGAAAQLSQTLTVLRSGQRLLLRSTDGRPATLFVGERFPVLLNTYAATLNAPAVVPTITSASFPRSDFSVGTHPAAVVAPISPAMASPIWPWPTKTMPPSRFWRTTVRATSTRPWSCRSEPDRWPSQQPTSMAMASPIWSSPAATPIPSAFFSAWATGSLLRPRPMPSAARRSPSPWPTSTGTANPIWSSPIATTTRSPF